MHKGPEGTGTYLTAEMSLDVLCRFITVTHRCRRDTYMLPPGHGCSVTLLPLRQRLALGEYGIVPTRTAEPVVAAVVGPDADDNNGG